MKKILFTLVALCVTLSSWGFAVNQIVQGYNAETKALYEGIDFAIVSNDEANLTCCVQQCTLSGDVTIPGKIIVENKEIKVVASSPYWENPVRLSRVYTGDIQTLTFEEGLTTLYPFSLSGCTARKIVLPSTYDATKGGESFGALPNMKQVVISEKNTRFKVITSTVGNNDFVVNKNTGELFWILLKDHDGNNLTEIHIPEGVTTIATSVDIRLLQSNSNQGVTKVCFPKSFKGIGKWVRNLRHAFTYYGGLKEFYVDPENPDFCSYEGVIYKKPFAVVDGEQKEWGIMAYLAPEGVFKNETVTLPAGVTSIDELAFEQTKMSEIIISDDVEKIGGSAFYQCTNLKKITIPAKTTELGEGFLGGCTRLEEIVLLPGNPNYASYLGSLYTKDYKTILAFPYAKSNEKDAEGKVIPYALHPDTETIGSSAFNGANKISEIDLKSAPGLKVLELGCMANMSNLENLLIPASVQRIKRSALNGLASLKSLEFENNDNPDSKLTIESYSMQTGPGVNKVEEIVFPKQLVKIENVSLEGATKVSFAEGSRLNSIGSFTNYSMNVEEIDMTNCTQLTSIPTGFVQKCENLKVLKLPASLTSIGGNAFYNTTALETLEFGVGAVLKNIGANTFQNCGARNIILPDHVETVASEAFAYCENLEVVTIPATAKDINPQAFKYCNNLVNIAVDPANPKYASTDGMLATKDKKTLLIFPPGKASLAGTMISPSFEKIGEYAFYACTKLTGIIIPKHVETIGNYAFEYCDNLNSITFLGDVPPVNVDADVTADNAKAEYNKKDHRFGNFEESPREFLKNHVTINLRKNGNEEMYKATNSYWNDCLDYTYSFSAQNGKNEDGGKNKYDYLATSLTSVAVLGSQSTNYTALVPEKVVNPDNGKEYSVAIVGDYAFENMSPNVKEIVFLGPIELIGANAFNNGHLNNVYTKEPTSSIEQIIFANTESVGQNELSTKRFELGTEFGTEEYPEFTKTQKIYVAKSKLAGYKENMPKFASQIDYKIPGIKIGSKYGTFSREFDVDLEDEDANWDAENSRPKVAAFTGYVETVVDEDRDFTYILMRSINCDEESKTTVKGSGDGTYIPANTGVLLRAYTDGKTPDGFYYRIGEQKSSFEAPQENVMMTVTETGTTIQPTDGDFTNYVISGGKYYSLTGSTNIPVHKSYIHVKEVKNSKGVKLVFAFDGETTGIEEIETVKPVFSEATYNLQGQRVNAGTKGIVIVNGKKMYNM